MKTEYDGSIKGLKIAICISVIVGIFLPILIYQINIDGTANAVVQYIGTIIGSIISVCGAILAVLITLRRQKIKEEKEQRVYIKLKLKKLYEHFNNYYMDNTFLGMPTEILQNDNLVYNYANQFLNFYTLVYEQFAEINEDLFDEFGRQFEEEFKVCTWILRFEKMNSRKFMASLLDIYNIFSNEKAREILRDIEEKNANHKEERYEYTDFEVFRVLETNLSDKIISFIEKIGDELTSI